MIKKILFIAFVVFGSTVIFAQTTVTGTVKDIKSGDLLLGANIKISNKAVGTTSDFDGNFILKTTKNPPFTIEVSMLGFKTTKIKITKNNEKVNIILTENETSLDEIVISASRTPERIMESPVTIERLDARAIKNTSSISFYDGLENLKGVDVNTSSLTFKSVNTRGFATFANTRFMQLVDGMDNSSPALNFALGNLLGMSELDVKTVELLPGASSALYGANAFNGIMFMTSRSPFEDQGISVSSKTGITKQQAGGNNIFSDTSIRMAYAFSEKFAAKATFSYLKGTEWFATDYRNTSRGKYIAGDRDSDLNYDGLNVYGDEVAINIGVAAKTGIIPNVNVSRTGYKEIDLMTYDDTKSIKLNASLNYRPYGNDKLEIIWNSKFGLGNTIYQGLNRYNIKNFYMAQHKLEVKGTNFFVRGYMTTEDAGNSYDTRFAAININRLWKSDKAWFGDYISTYAKATLLGKTADQAHIAARKVADTGRLIPGTDAFKTALAKVTADPSLTTGSKFLDNTKLYHADANYNFKNHIDFAEIQVGGSYRRYSLNSHGSIFTDYDGSINYDEYGVYTQFQKKFIDDRLKLTASARYDKAQNFAGNVSPRISFAYAGGEDKNQNFRASFQTGFRNPTTQDQYIGLDAGRAILVGSAPDNLDRYTSRPLPVNSNVGRATVGANTVSLSGRRAYDNAFTANSLKEFGKSVKAGAPNISLLKQANTALVKPEKVTAYEIGYRGIATIAEKNITIDVSVYYNAYQDFISSKAVIVPYYGKVSDYNPANFATDTNTRLLVNAISTGEWQAFSTYTNTTADISSMGATIGLKTKIFNDFKVGLNYTYAKFNFDQASDLDFEAGFNTPKHKVKFQFGKQKVFGNLGFNMNVRWQSEYLWESTFHDAIMAERTMLDAQVNYSFPKIKSVLKIGGTNLTGKEYFSAPGIGAIGSQYYISLTINN